MDKLSVLIIDDSEEDRYILKRMLDELEFDITIFEKKNGQEAIEFMSAFEENQKQYPNDYPPRIIFLDINMPLKDGHQVLTEFSEIWSKYNISSSIVMMFTSSAREDDHTRAMQYDFVKGVLLKGQFSTDELRKAIIDYL